MAPRYTQVPSAEAQDRDEEMDAAFASDDENEDESTPLNRQAQADNHSSPQPILLNSTPAAGLYDFDRDYDYPPPGSPPRPSALALPNDIGNSNGSIPDPSTASASRPQPSRVRRFFQNILPIQNYERLDTEAQTSRRMGGGVENDGVFANVMAKPQRAQVVRGENGEVHVMPETSQKEAPPSYVEAQADAVPPYWETTVHAPQAIEGSDMIIDDLPSGSVLSFVVNCFISWFFQYLGFMMTYLLHTTNAAKYGSRAGLGMTLIQYGFFSRLPPDGSNGSSDDPDWVNPTVPTTNGTQSTNSSSNDFTAIGPRDWLSFLLMTLGWFLLLSSLVGFLRVKRWEASIRATTTAPSTQDIENDRAVRQTLISVLGIRFAPEQYDQNRVLADEHGNVIVIPGADALAEQRLTNDLRNAGLI